MSILESPKSESVHLTVGYVTDIEGNYDYWQRYVTLSKVLTRNKDTNLLELRENCAFVFGGDVCDRGPGDIRVVQELLDLKRNYMDRIHFILGNRDANKLRLDVELHPNNLSQPGEAYWIDQKSGENGQSGEDRLKWILTKTMGSPGAFEYRKQELQETGKPFSGEDIVNSYRGWVDPDGDMTRFLENGKIAVIIGDTIYVHGAIKPTNIGWVPPRRCEISGGYRVDNIHEWCDHINAWVKDEMVDYRRYSRQYIAACLRKFGPTSPIPCWAEEGGYNHPMPGSRLLQYGMGWMPDKAVNPSAIYACYLNSASPTFTAKLVRTLTETAAKNATTLQMRVSFRKAVMGAAILTKLQKSSRAPEVPTTVINRLSDSLDTNVPAQPHLSPRGDSSTGSARYQSPIGSAAPAVRFSPDLKMAEISPLQIKLPLVEKVVSKVESLPPTQPSTAESSPQSSARVDTASKESVDYLQTCVNYIVLASCMVVDKILTPFVEVEKPRPPAPVTLPPVPQQVQIQQQLQVPLPDSSAEKQSLAAAPAGTPVPPLVTPVFTPFPEGTTNQSPMPPRPPSESSADLTRVKPVVPVLQLDGAKILAANSDNDSSLRHSKDHDDWTLVSPAVTATMTDEELLARVPHVEPVGGLFTADTSSLQVQSVPLPKHEVAEVPKPSAFSLKLSLPPKSGVSSQDLPDLPLSPGSQALMQRSITADSELSNVPTPRLSPPVVRRTSSLSSADMFATPEDQMNEFLLKSGIKKVVVGHQPRGDAPLVLDNGGVKVISADTSYAVNVQWVNRYNAPVLQYPSHPLDQLPPPPADSTRGIAVCEVLNTYSQDLESQTYLHGRLSNGLDYQFELNDSELIGKKTAHNWYVKAAGVIAIEEVASLNDTQGDTSNIIDAPPGVVPKLYYLMSQLDGFTVKNRLVCYEDIAKEFPEDISVT